MLGCIFYTTAIIKITASEWEHTPPPMLGDTVLIITLLIII